MHFYSKSLVFSLALILSACAYEIKQDKPFEVKTIEVHHTFDFATIEEYYYSRCFEELKCKDGDSLCKNAAKECAKSKTADFLDSLAAITQAGAANGT